MTTLGGCLQKTYYSVPTALQNVNNASAISIYPNPANTNINVIITSATSGDIQVEILNMMGQKVSMTTAMDNMATINVAALPTGYYLVNCYRDGVKIAVSRFIKN
jgi:hypothetical protein